VTRLSFLSLFCLLTIAPDAEACDARLRAGPLDLATASLDDITMALGRRRVTSVQLVDAYLSRIAACNPELHAVISINAAARTAARALDAERAAGSTRGPLHGVPVIIKDNIDLAGAVTTAGSLALARNTRANSAALVERLTAAGLVVIAKSNLSEWANFRSRQATSGWSAMGGLVVNPRDARRSACGSSSGSAVAVVAHLAPLAVGTETNGSIVCPASVMGVVGFKPTVGWVSTSGVVPISRTQDTPGPLAASVTDAALLLGALVDAPHARDFRAGLHTDALRGARLGVARFMTGFGPRTGLAFERMLAVLKGAGAELVDIPAFDFRDLRDLESTILSTEFKAGIDDYLAGAPATVETRTLAGLIEFNRHEPRELEWFGQDSFEQAQAAAGLDDPAYSAALHKALGIARVDGIDRLLADNRVVALVAPTNGPAWTVDLVNGDRAVGSASLLPAVAGYPHLTVPAADVAGLPVGLSFIGTAGSDATLLSLAYAFERARSAN
jgi:amidase